MIAAGVGVIGIAVVAPLVGSQTSSNAGAISGATAPSTVESATGSTTATVPGTGSGVPGSGATDVTGSSGVTDSSTVFDVGGDTDEGCKITERSIRQGSTGQSVTCLQRALAAAGYLTTAPTGTYDYATVQAVRKLQTAKDLYSRTGQRVWAIDENGQIIRSWLVSGSKYENEKPGEHKVYSRSEVSTAWNGKAYLNKMVRWLKTDIGAIGFHSLPIHVSDGTVYQTEAELGQRLSGGCQRQAPLDAAFTWDFAQVGTIVFVV